MGCKHTPLPERKPPMPRLTYSTPKPSALSIQEELHCLHLAVKLRSEQVKLRRLEWDTQELALPHIWPLSGDSELQIRTPLTPADMPAPRPPVKRPNFAPGMPSELMQTMLELYMSELRCLLYTSPSPRDLSTSRMPSSA